MSFMRRRCQNGASGQRGNPRFPPFPGTSPGGVLVPSIRGVKISEDESPFPQDRVYFGFNYWDNVNAALNKRLFSDLNSLRAYRAQNMKNYA